MFIAGIEIFFGFVAGAILLVLLINCLRLAGYVIAAIFIAVSRLFAAFLVAFPPWFERRAGWILGIAVYCVIMFTLGNSPNPTILATGSFMGAALIVAMLVKFYLLSRVKQKR
jgi:hypothetical protein